MPRAKFADIKVENSERNSSLRPHVTTGFRDGRLMSSRCWQLGHFPPEGPKPPDLPCSDNKLRTETSSPPISRELEN